MPDDFEQQTDTTEPTTTEPAAGDSTTRDDLIAALREAVPGGADSVNDEATPEERAAAEAAEAAKTEPAAVEEEPKYARLLREREKAQAEREAGRNAGQQLIDQAKAEAAKLIEDARKAAQEAIAQERERWQSRYQQDPDAALAELGAPEDIARRVIAGSTPEGKELARIRAELAEAKANASEGKTARAEIAALKQAQADQAQAARIAQLRETFLGGHANQAKAPYLHARYDADEIFQKANDVAVRWQKEGLTIHEDFDFDDITSYLENDAKKRISALGVTPAQQVRAVPGLPAGSASKVPANGSRTISAAAGSERRATQKPISEMTPEEERRALIEASSEAKRSFGRT